MSKWSKNLREQFNHGSYALVIKPTCLGADTI